MGMDYFEIIFKIEEEFGVEVSIDQSRAIVRDNDIHVGDLYALILAKTQVLQNVKHDLRINFALWREIQSTVHGATGFPLGEIAPSTRLDRLFPRFHRRETWRDLAAALPYDIPGLEFPRGIRFLASLVALGVVLVELDQLRRNPAAPWIRPFLVLCLLGVFYFAKTYTAVLTPFRLQFPRGMKTLKDLCRSVIAKNFERLAPLDEPQISLDHRSYDLWLRLTKILAETLHVEAASITFQSRLGRDLAMS
jgi:hypothetical protein